MKNKVHFSTIKGNTVGFYALVAILGLIAAIGLGAAYYMEHNGHWVTGMNNQVVWGMPHVFAIFLIVAASGAVNVATIGSVFGRKIYKPLGRLSGLVAIAMLAGGLMVLVLDLGHPDRLIVAMTYFNFKSIFAWNIFLYTGFFVIVAAYLWTMMDKSVNKHSRKVGIATFLWRLALTTGTGSIFGFLVARQHFDAAIMAPMFIIMSFSFGLAIYLLILLYSYQWTRRPLGDTLVCFLKNLLGVFVASVLYFVLVKHLTNLYATEHHGIERFILVDGGIYTFLFWVVQIGLGSVLPLVILFSRLGKSFAMLKIASLLVILGGMTQIYVILIGGQAYPLKLFPGMEVSSIFYDGVVASYSPTLPEFLLGFGGFAVALLLVIFAVRVLRFLPVSLANEVVDPHAAVEKEAG